MKCEHCGKNEVTFVSRSNINGHITEQHLCGECAEKLGVTRRLTEHSRRMRQDFDRFFGRSLFDDFFTPMPSLLGRMERMLESPFEDIFAAKPALRSGETPKEAPKQEELVDEESRSRFARERELNALRLEMKQAAEQENFERAAELRDRIRALEAPQTDARETWASGPMYRGRVLVELEYTGRARSWSFRVHSGSSSSMLAS